MFEKLKMLLLSKYCVLIAVVAIGLLSQVWLGADNIVEEIAEEYIKEATGKDVEFSPHHHQEYQVEDSEEKTTLKMLNTKLYYSLCYQAEIAKEKG